VVLVLLLPFLVVLPTKQAADDTTTEESMLQQHHSSKKCVSNKRGSACGQSNPNNVGRCFCPQSPFSRQLSPFQAIEPQRRGSLFLSTARFHNFDQTVDRDQVLLWVSTARHLLRVDKQVVDAESNE